MGREALCIIAGEHILPSMLLFLLSHPYHFAQQTPSRAWTRPLGAPHQTVRKRLTSMRPPVHTQTPILRYGVQGSLTSRNTRIGYLVQNNVTQVSSHSLHSSQHSKLTSSPTPAPTHSHAHQHAPHPNTPCTASTRTLAPHSLHPFAHHVWHFLKHAHTTCCTQLLHITRFIYALANHLPRIMHP
jgi:hypothetical protein